MSVLDLQRPLARLTLLNGTLPPALAWCPYHSSQAHTVCCIDLSPRVKTFTFQWPLFKSVHMQIPKIQYHSSNLHLSVSVLHNSVREKKHSTSPDLTCPAACPPVTYVEGQCQFYDFSQTSFNCYRFFLANCIQTDHNSRAISDSNMNLDH